MDAVVVERPLLTSLAWIAGIIIVLPFLAVRRYRRVT